MGLYFYSILFPYLFVSVLSVITGFVFALIWKEDIKKRLNVVGIKAPDHKINFTFSGVEKGIVGTGLGISLIFILILTMFFGGSLTSHLSPSKIERITPASNKITDINNSNNQIQITFTYPMKEINSIYSSCSWREECSIEYIWTDNKTFIIKFDRKLHSDEKVEFTLSRIIDAEGRIFEDEISLQYE